MATLALVFDDFHAALEVGSRWSNPLSSVREARRTVVAKVTLKEGESLLRAERPWSTL